jgi:hypothetical protein
MCGKIWCWKPLKGTGMGYRSVHMPSMSRSVSEYNVCALFHSCWECTLALYCSEACRQESWDQYHQWECHGGLEVLHSVGIAHLGVRVILKAGSLTTLRDFHVKLQESGFQLQDTYGDRNYNYKAVYQLVSHLEDMKHEDLFQYAMVQLLEAHLLYCVLWNHSQWQVINAWKHIYTQFKTELMNAG